MRVGEYPPQGNTREPESLEESNKITTDKNSTDDDYKNDFLRANPMLRLKDIIGQHEAQQALFEACILPQFLPAEAFKGCLSNASRSVLLFGPPGRVL